jgi:hypothetical protein
MRLPGRACFYILRRISGASFGKSVKRGASSERILLLFDIVLDEEVEVDRTAYYVASTDRRR